MACAIPYPPFSIKFFLRRDFVNPEGPKSGVLQGSKVDASRKPAAAYNIADSLYNLIGPTFVEKIGTFLDGYGSSLRSRALKPHKKIRPTLPIN